MFVHHLVLFNLLVYIISEMYCFSFYNRWNKKRLSFQASGIVVSVAWCICWVFWVFCGTLLLCFILVDGISLSCSGLFCLFQLIDLLFKHYLCESQDFFKNKNYYLLPFFNKVVLCKLVTSTTRSYVWHKLLFVCI